MRHRVLQVGPTDRLIRALTHSVFARRQAPHLAAWLKHPERTLRKQFEVEFQGFRYPGMLTNRIDWSVFFIADFLALEVELIRRAAETMRRLRNSFVCYDIGANIGHMTLAMANLADQVVAFDPSPYAIARLREKVSINHISNVRYLNVAVGEDDAVVPFDIFSADNYRAKRVKVGPLEQAFGRFDAAVRHGDEVVMRKRLPRPDFLRINAGDDYTMVLRGLKDTIVSAQPIILIERPAGYCVSVSETSLQETIYPRATLYELKGKNGTCTIRLETFSENARQIVCLPEFISRMAEQEHAKMRSLGMVDEP